MEKSTSLVIVPNLDSPPCRYPIVMHGAVICGPKTHVTQLSIPDQQAVWKITMYTCLCIVITGWVISAQSSSSTKHSLHLPSSAHNLHIRAVFLYSCPNCSSCPIHPNSIGWVIWASRKKYSLVYTNLEFCSTQPSHWNAWSTDLNLGTDAWGGTIWPSDYWAGQINDVISAQLRYT